MHFYFLPFSFRICVAIFSFNSPPVFQISPQIITVELHTLYCCIAYIMLLLDSKEILIYKHKIYLMMLL